MKDFARFLKEEVELRGNQGIPDDFMGKADDEAKAEHGFRRKDVGPGGFFGPSEMDETAQQLMQTAEESTRLIYSGRGEEVNNRVAALEKLAEDTVMMLYGDILDNVILDIKLVRPGAVHQNVDFSQVPQTPRNIRSEWISDVELRKKVDMRKIINNVIQGEALNTKNILHMPFVRDEIMDIFGPQGQQIFDIWDRLTKLAGKLDWLFPLDMKAGMMDQHPQGMAGAVKVTWEEESDEEQPQQPEEDQEYQPEDPDESNLNPEQYDPNNDEESEMGSYTPKIIVRAVDFPMLLHEAVKGIYELIGSVSFPDENATEDEKKDAETVKQNTSSMLDESEDHRYGPYIASRLREAVNECDGASDYPNTREFVFGRLCAMEPDAFLRIMKKILDDNESAKNELEVIIREINGEIEAEERDHTLSQLDGDNDDTPALADGDEEDGESELDKLIARTARGETGPEPQGGKEEEEDLSKYSLDQLNDMIIQALNSDDMERFKKLSTYAKGISESLVVNAIKKYLRS